MWDEFRQADLLQQVPLLHGLQQRSLDHRRGPRLRVRLREVVAHQRADHIVWHEGLGWDVLRWHEQASESYREHHGRGRGGARPGGDHAHHGEVRGRAGSPACPSGARSRQRFS
eukprot:7061425-Pyramimonas_sp.AAC.1